MTKLMMYSTMGLVHNKSDTLTFQEEQPDWTVISDKGWFQNTFDWDEDSFWLTIAKGKDDVGNLEYAIWQFKSN